MSIGDNYKVGSDDCAVIFTGGNYTMVMLPYYYNGSPQYYLKSARTDGQFVALYSNGVSMKTSFESTHTHVHLQLVTEMDDYYRFFEFYTDGRTAMLKQKSEFVFMHARIISINELNLIEYSPYPDSRIFEYVLQSDFKDMIITVDRPEFDWNYSSFRLTVFQRDKVGIMQPKVLDCMRFKDGGTTIITTDIGTLTVPTQLTFEPQPPTWSGTDGSSPGAILTQLETQMVSDELSYRFMSRLQRRIGVNNPYIKNRM